MFKAWEPAKNLDNAKKAINGFEERQRKIIGSEFELEREPKVSEKSVEKERISEPSEKQNDYNKILAKMTENLGNLQRLKDEQPAKKSETKETGNAKQMMQITNSYYYYYYFHSLTLFAQSRKKTINKRANSEKMGSKRLHLPNRRAMVN